MSSPTAPTQLTTISSVKVGGVTLLQSKMAAGTVIHNPSLVDSVWVSENMSVAVGAGWRIGPLGSILWTADDSSVYACVDSGVTNPVNVIIGNAIGEIDNPVDIAIAVALGTPTAQQIGDGVATAVGGSVNGIPALGTGIQLVNQTFNGAGTNFTLQADITDYASVMVLIDDTGLAAADIADIEIQFYAGAVFATPLLFNDTFTTSVAVGLAFTPLHYPALGTQVTVKVVTTKPTSSITVTVMGLSSDVYEPMALSQAGIQQGNLAAQAWAAGQTAVIPSNNTQGWPLAGWAQLAIFISGMNSVTGYLQILTADGNSGSILAATQPNDIVAFGATRMILSKPVILPRAPFNVRWSNFVASTANYSIVVELTPLR